MMTDEQAEQNRIWVSIRTAMRVADREGTEIDLSGISDEELLYVYDEEFLGLVNFIADMCDDYSVVRREKAENNRIWDVVAWAVDQRGI